MVKGNKMKNLRNELKGFLKHWYLGGGTTENRKILTPDTQAKEKIAYRMIRELLNDDDIISPTASPLSLPHKVQKRK
jgi:hypothetical protein